MNWNLCNGAFSASSWAGRTNSDHLRDDRARTIEVDFDSCVGAIIALGAILKAVVGGGTCIPFAVRAGL